MTKLYFFGFIFTFSFGISSAQNVDMSADAVTKVLCKKWKLDYTIYNGMKISPGPTEKYGLFFQNNHTFNMNESDISNRHNPKNTYTWKFDPQKKWITLKTDVNNSKIISLNDDELIMLTSLKVESPADTAGIESVFIPQF